MDRATTSSPSTTPVTSSLHEPPESHKRIHQPSSSHLDSTLSHFADPTFDPVDYLNNILPSFSLSLSSPQTTTTATATIPTTKDRAASATAASTPVSLAALSTQTQSLISQLSAQNARLSNTLTQLTDEILRGGGRLAYEVEVLRGEAVGLSDALREELAGDIELFVPGGKVPDISMSTRAEEEAVTKTQAEASEPADNPAQTQQPQTQVQPDDEQQQQSQPKEPGQEAQSETQPASNEPLYLTHLRTLTNVRARLEQVIHTFGEAMEWPLAPSETSLASSFISVSAPEPGTESQHSREEKGKEVAKKLRAEIIELLDKDTGTTDADGVEAANRRVEALRELVGVWKGTAEEKARMRFVDGLAKLVEERRKVVQSETESKGGGGSKSGLRGDSNAGRDGRGGGGQEGKGSAGTTTTAPASGGGGGGLLRNLQRLRDEIYLD
ncbi:hypothetical protein RJZ56_002649 [Blastomyces dermatitidis]|uniref:Uncharacterized protein n=3 Tax=Blastomyces TaxID=229219 RepID=A0A179UYE6_BLAGS|nr:uncharacterized protein BDBG_08373 [Blastomyces gilchristii SLH14081]XP_045276718.1 uncharacterized protein BDCG_05000 [Blastomyces dermatitidis ER-3]EGE80920.1 hypothetical protein BDDG_03861 [Blastomyces dermatitidis ATCC 18188]EQL37862.1 hypothetical protein BDFG_00896 [Blastomyces dermatitidis ATCC 26199]EEQ89880.1 hypothetical protein BDCG_05000 [Blastomyces dermatitidis ER-3]OAT13106.1 hypothetical protein BDBG_08373 [Blastomyces gilchristii SLH14081]